VTNFGATSAFARAFQKRNARFQLKWWAFTKTDVDCAPAADFFQHFAVGHLRKAVSAISFRRSHPEHADAPQTINHASWNVCLPIDLPRIEMFVQKFAEFRSVSSIPSVGPPEYANTASPNRNEMSLEQPLGKTKAACGPAKAAPQLVEISFLSGSASSLLFSFALEKKARRIVAVAARVSSPTAAALKIQASVI